MRFFLTIMVLGLMSWGFAPRLMACSSCGSGGEDPLILFPNEDRKLYFGLTREDGYRDINYDGQKSRTQGILRRQSLLLAYGHRLTSRLVVLGSVPYFYNSHGDESYQAFGDGQLSFRYDLYQQTFADPLIPQVQLLLARRHASTRSIETSRDPYFLDAVGGGYHETRMGLDLFSGMTALVYGLSGSVTYYEPSIDDRGRQEKAPLFTWNLTVGYSDSTYKLITGLVAERQGKRRTGGEEIERSDHLKHNLFLTGEAQLTPLDRIRLSLVQKATPRLPRRQTAEATSLTFAYMRQLP